jgi:hypothetical protein
MYPGIATALYGVFSFNIDAPRHLFIYSEKAIKRLAKRSGFYIAEKINLPIWGNLAISAAYQRGILWTDFHSAFAKGEIWENPIIQEQLFEILARCSDLIGCCDFVRFTLKRIKEEH